ncbi:glycosyltransferase family 2 protein [Micromonospora sp. CPCC 206061]|uniref:glycosyltransferase family 2 protein n=1 Tax=Micromonospora sp. CPCC 206061 TaxID=3122410 RepID=UPI002FF0A1CE
MTKNTIVEPAVSIVIPTYNACDELRHTLRALVRQTLRPDSYEVLVVDDGSSDPTHEVVTEFRDRLRLAYTRLERDEAGVATNGYCVSRVRNAGARLARAPLLLFLDTGVIAGRDLVAEHLAAHAREPGGAVLGYCYGTYKLKPFPGLAELLRSRTPEEVAADIGDGPRGLDLRHDAFEAYGWDLGKLAAPWINFWAMNASVPARAFWAVGGFDEDFRGWGYEYMELGYRLFRYGLRLAVARRAWGIEWPTPRPVLVANSHGSGRNLNRFLAKHRHPDVELYAILRTRSPVTDFEREHAVLCGWQERARNLDVTAELAGLAADARAAGRVAVLGCGGGVPAGWPPSVLVDFDAELLARAAAGGAHRAIHAIGLSTGLPDQCVDLVVVTSRLRGVWDRWGDRVAAEARRVGRHVRVAFTDPEPESTIRVSIA